MVLVAYITKRVHDLTETHISRVDFGLFVCAYRLVFSLLLLLCCFSLLLLLLLLLAFVLFLFLLLFFVLNYETFFRSFKLHDNSLNGTLPVDNISC